MSAGAQSVNYLMATPAARGLFHRAVSESSAIHMFRPYRLREASGGKPASEEMGRQLAAARGIDDGPDAAARLRQVPVEWLLDYQARHLGGMYEPVIDGRLLRESVGEAFRAGREAPVPYLAGATNWEGSLSASFGSKDATRRLESLNMSRDDARRLHGDLDDETLQQRLDTDAFLGSQRWLVRRHAANGYPSWLYYFTYTLQAHRGEFPGAPHGGEVRYVFGTLDGLARIQDRPMGSIVSPADRDMAATVSGYWVSMATSGDPNGGGRPVWPACTPADDASLELGVEVRARRDMLGERMRFIEARLDAGDI
jgi:para-nitrobenzyl esterase